MLTTICMAGDQISRPVPYRHHVVNLKDRNRKRHRVKCIEVPYITSVQEKPDFSKVQEMFPCIPVGTLNRPNTEIGLLLGQNANSLLPTRGSGNIKSRA